jgi:hypothetical protein
MSLVMKFGPVVAAGRRQLGRGSPHRANWACRPSELHAVRRDAVRPDEYEIDFHASIDGRGRRTLPEDNDKRTAILTVRALECFRDAPVISEHAFPAKRGGLADQLAVARRLEADPHDRRAPRAGVVRT